MNRATANRLGELTDEELAEELLTRCAGLDVTDPQGQRTPNRFVLTLRELTTPDKNWEFTMFDGHCDEMVTERNIPFVSMCKHHVLPFMGIVHVGYVPDISIAGLSKIPRLVEACSRKLQIQEELTKEIALELSTKLDPKGVAVVIDAKHMCMGIRGARTPDVVTRTSSMLGVFGDHDKTAKAEFMSGIRPL
jgi:GTP cyclohydrolase I